ncbi:cuticle protein 6-like [Ischnura elegans]|uniref:cuticle protein 6-like n=1 Tax=Ischnura elegans TaxID=197161 RepID=UPI001ED8B5BA|nr:cuticle protein 6-like [Ischnura elegans]
MSPPALKMHFTLISLVALFWIEEFSAAVQPQRAINKYLYPVPIPASSEAHFAVRNANDGTYHFGYDTGGNQHQSYREEKRDAKGRVKGKYGYVDPTGVLRVIEYEADENGYRSNLISHFPVRPSLPSFIGPIPTPLLKRILASGLK